MLHRVESQKRYNPGLFSTAFQDDRIRNTLPCLIPFFCFTHESIVFNFESFWFLEGHRERIFLFAYFSNKGSDAENI